jgi:hypothetical protein
MSSEEEVVEDTVFGHIARLLAARELAEELAEQPLPPGVPHISCWQTQKLSSLVGLIVYRDKTIEIISYSHHKIYRGWFPDRKYNTPPSFAKALIVGHSTVFQVRLLATEEVIKEYEEDTYY